MHDGPASIWELIGSDDFTRVNAMLELYARLFPQYAHYVPRMRRRAVLMNNIGKVTFSIIGWLRYRKPAGIRTFRYVRHRHCGLAHALAIDPVYREVMIEGQRLSMFLIGACLDQVIKDAQRFGDRAALGMVNEVEFASIVGALSNSMASSNCLFVMSSRFFRRNAKAEVEPMKFRSFIFRRCFLAFCQIPN